MMLNDVSLFTAGQSGEYLHARKPNAYGTVHRPNTYAPNPTPNPGRGTAAAYTTRISNAVPPGNALHTG